MFYYFGPEEWIGVYLVVLCGEIQDSLNGRGMFGVGGNTPVSLWKGSREDQIRRQTAGVFQCGSGQLRYRPCLLVRASSEVKLNGSNKCFGPADALWPAIKRDTVWRKRHGAGSQRGTNGGQENNVSTLPTLETDLFSVKPQLWRRLPKQLYWWMLSKLL